MHSLPTVVLVEVDVVVHTNAVVLVEPLNVVVRVTVVYVIVVVLVDVDRECVSLMPSEVQLIS